LKPTFVEKFKLKNQFTLKLTRTWLIRKKMSRVSLKSLDMSLDDTRSIQTLNSDRRVRVDPDLEFSSKFSKNSEAESSQFLAAQQAKNIPLKQAI
jgi:hypothetical protein